MRATRERFMPPAEVRAALDRLADEPSLSPRDRARVNATRISRMQGEITPAEMASRIDEMLPFFREHADPDVLGSMLGIAATIAALDGDMDACLVYAHDLETIRRHNPEIGVSTTANNLGLAFLALGAFELAASQFVQSLGFAPQENSARAVVAASTNLALAVSRSKLIRGAGAIEPFQEDLRVAAAALRELRLHEDEPGTDAFISAGLAQLALVDDDPELASQEWGDLDAFTAHPTEAFVRFFSMVELPIALHRRDNDRVVLLANRCLTPTEDHDLVPLRRVQAHQALSTAHERLGNAQAALDHARLATQVALTDAPGEADALIRLVGEAADLEQRQQRLLDRTTELREQAMVDELSRAGNRRALDRHVESLGLGPEMPIAMLVIDLDNFKHINDQFGHPTGDRVIARASAICAQACRASDPVFRIGGDEFVVVAETDSLAHARILADRIRAGFLAEPWTLEGIDHPVTCSIGVSVGLTSDFAPLLPAADARLYEAKQAGRNCVRPEID